MTRSNRRLLHYGKGVPQDHIEAEKWLRKAIEKSTGGVTMRAMKLLRAMESIT